VSISGAITYDFVPNLFAGGLNYAGTQALPARGVTLQLLNASGAVVDSDVASALGEYSLEGEPNTLYSVRARAELKSTTSPTWDIRVEDNVNGDAQFVLDGSLLTTGSGGSVRNLHAASGWGGSAYTTTRAAAPFAIVDSVYQVLDELLSAGLNQNLPILGINWSTENRANDGRTDDGDIGTSHFSSGETEIYILGDQNNDTDEYDRSVVQHEFGHYLEDALSRSQNIGGSHGAGDKLDMRVAFGEGIANALTAYTSGTGRYFDSGGGSQQFGFRIDIEDFDSTNLGWYSEESIAALVYDFMDPANETDDTLDLGFEALISTISDSEYVSSDAFSSIFLYLDTLKNNSASQISTAISSAALSHNINGDDEWGSNESNNGGASGVLPIYNTLSLGTTVNVCTNDSEQIYNGLDVRRYIRITLPRLANYRFTITTASQSTGNKNPEGILHLLNEGVFFFNSSSSNTEANTLSINANNYILEVYDLNNTQLPGAGIACFDVSVSEI
jgi:hypothetical protein